MQRMTVILGCGLAAMATCFSAAHAQQGYDFELVLTTDGATHDPDGVWKDDDLQYYQSSMPKGFRTKIYTARVRTPAGEWLLTQTNGDCNMQGMCTTLLYLLRSGQPPKEMASAQVQQAGGATLSQNYKKLTTTEVGQDGKPFIGAYDVEPVK